MNLRTDGSFQASGTRRAEYGLSATPQRLKSQRRGAVRTLLAPSYVPDAARRGGLFNMDFGEDRRSFGPKFSKHHVHATDDEGGDAIKNLESSETKMKQRRNRAVVNAKQKLAVVTTKQKS